MPIGIQWPGATEAVKKSLDAYCDDRVLTTTEVAGLTSEEKAVLEKYFSGINLDGKKDISLDVWLEQLENKTPEEEKSNDPVPLQVVEVATEEAVEAQPAAAASEAEMESETPPAEDCSASGELSLEERVYAEPKNARILKNTHIVEKTIAGAITGAILFGLAKKPIGKARGGMVLGAILVGLLVNLATRKSEEAKQVQAQERMLAMQQQEHTEKPEPQVEQEHSSSQEVIVQQEINNDDNVDIKKEDDDV